MPRHATRDATRARGAPVSARLGAFATLVLTATMTTGIAHAEPPITSLQDAACRNEARARVFSVPDPQNLGLHEIGRRIYYACMKRASRPVGKTRYRRRRR